MGYLQRLAESALRPPERLHPAIRPLFLELRSETPLAYFAESTGTPTAAEIRPFPDAVASERPGQQRRPQPERQPPPDAEPASSEPVLPRKWYAPPVATPQPPPEPQPVSSRHMFPEEPFAPPHVPPASDPGRPQEDTFVSANQRAAPTARFPESLHAEAAARPRVASPLFPSRGIEEQPMPAAELRESKRSHARAEARPASLPAALPTGRRRERPTPLAGYAPAPHAPDEIQIHIGRIEVTAAPPPAAPPIRRPPRKTPSLDEYLKNSR